MDAEVEVAKTQPDLRNCKQCGQLIDFEEIDLDPDLIYMCPVCGTELET